MFNLDNERIWSSLCSGFLGPLNGFLDFYGQDIEWFIQQIVLESSTATQMINDFARYGAFDILLPLNEVFSTCMGPEYSMSWRKEWENISYSNKFLYDSADSFHNRLIQEADDRLFDITKMMQMMSGYQLYEMIWQSYLKNFWQYPQYLEYNMDLYLGVLMPGIYVEELKKDYIDAVYRYTFPHIFLLNGEINKFPVNKVLKAIIQKTILCFGSELGHQYYNAAASAVSKIICSDKVQGDDIEYASFFNEAVLEQNGCQLNMDLDKVEKLEKLSDCIDQYGLRQYGCRKLQFFLPVAQQLVGRTREASKRLIALNDQVDKLEKTKSLFLLAYFRMWSREKGIAKQQAFVILNGLNTGALETSLKLYFDIAEFYRNFCVEFSKRFEENGLTELSEYSSENDFAFYNYQWNPYISGNSWFYETFVKSGTLLRIFKLLQENFENNEKDANLLLEWMHRFERLFHSLISHIEGDNSSPYNYFHRLRVDVKQLLSVVRSIEPGQYPDEPPKECSEIFGIYSPSQTELLIRLNARIKEVSINCPSHQERAVVEAILRETTSNFVGYQATWDNYSYFNSDKNKQFELLCRDLFRKIYFDNNLDVDFQTSSNNPGIEIDPIFCPKEGKYISFQAKYVSDSRSMYNQFRASAKMTVKIYKGKIDLLILFCNKDFTLKSKSFTEIVDTLKAAEIEVRTLCNQSILDRVNSDTRLLQRYFGSNLF